MIVQNIGYLKLDDVLNLEHFSIYETNKKTHVLIKNTSREELFIYFPQQDRLPYKTTEGKKICSGKKVFDSKTDSVKIIDTTKWNNGNQIMSYEEFSSF